MRLLPFAAPAALAALMLLGAGPVLAQTTTAPAGQAVPPNEQVIDPQVPRRDVRVPKIPSRDFIIGVFAGTYSTESFGASAVFGTRLGYHVTEDFMVEASWATTKVSDEAFRQILPGGIFPSPEQRLTYYNLSAGVNILPGEVFFGSRYAKPSALYFIAGVGSTKFLEQTKQTINFGLGLRVWAKDWMAVQFDVRDHIFPLDILGQRRSTQNLEFTGGLTFFF
jgi:outer membrane beta-barrel protein